MENHDLSNFRKSLPIFQYHEKIIEIISQNQFCVITGDTGSGKSTQLPQYIMDSPKIQKSLSENPKNKMKIVVTQPRRIAAISMAKRICHERNEILGDKIGYTIRFDDITSENTMLRYVTDGILVRQCLKDKDLNEYSIVVLDEAHERSLYTDVLFALVKQAVKRRKGSLKLIITSATLNTQQFSDFFEKCPLLQMEGRCFPVEIKYSPCLANKRVDEAVTSAIRMHLHEGPGDILVFLTGSEECEMASKLCYIKLQELLNKGREVPSMMIFCLYGAQSSEDQAKVFSENPENTRKLVFSTNIAETSLTIDGVGFVVDCGYVKQKHYNPRTGMDALIVLPISKVQAKQRAGRAGRTQPGKCLRLYSEQFYKDQMIEYTVPEILRANLANTILMLKDMDIHDVVNFDYMEHPDYEAIYQSLKQLYLLDAIDNNGKITRLGNEMCKLPLEPCYSKALISALLMNCSEEMLTMVSLLSTENIWSRVSRTEPNVYRKFEKKQYEFIDNHGDHLTYLKIYRRWVKNNYSDLWCKENFLNIRALKLAENIKIQLKDLIKQLDLKICLDFYENDFLYNIYKKHETILKSSKLSERKLKQITEYEKEILDLFDRFRLALTTGFYFNSARKVANSNQDYLLISEGNIVGIDFQSIYTLKEEFPDCVIFTELSGTSIVRGMMRLVTKIDLAWIHPYISKMKSVDLFKLAGSDNLKEKNVERIKDIRSENDEDKNEDSKQNKVNEAKNRYLERKKIKK